MRLPRKIANGAKACAPLMNTSILLTNKQQDVCIFALKSGGQGGIMKTFSGYKNACWLVVNLALLLSLSTGMAHAEQKPPLSSWSQNHSIGMPMMITANGILLLQTVRRPVARSVMDSIPRPDKVTGVKVRYRYGGVNVKWNAVTINGKPADHSTDSKLRYEVFRCENQSLSSCPSEGKQNSVNGNHVWPMSVSYTDRSVSEMGVWYYYRVRACTVHCSPLSDVARGAIMGPPANITASMGTYEDRVHISWSPVPIAEYYTVSRCSHRKDQCRVIANHVTSTSYDDRHAPGGIEVFYNISSCNKEVGERGGCWGAQQWEFVAGMKKKLQTVHNMKVSNRMHFYHRDYISIVSSPPRPEGVLAHNPVTQIYRCESYHVRNVPRSCEHIADGNYVFDRSAVPGRFYYYVGRYCGGGTCGDFQRHPDGSISIYEGKRNPLPIGVGPPDPLPPPRP